jgi:hypothetical protein
MVATVNQHGASDSGGLDDKASPKKDAQRRDKVSTRDGKATKPGQGLQKTFQNAGDVKKAPLACDRKQPES